MAIFILVTEFTKTLMATLMKCMHVSIFKTKNELTRRLTEHRNKKISVLFVKVLSLFLNFFPFNYLTSEPLL